MIEQSFYTLMISTSAITSIVGGRIHHKSRPENESGSAIVYQRVSTVPVTSMAGDSGLDSIRLQVSCWADSHNDSMALADLVRAAIKSSSMQGITAMLINDEDDTTGNKRTIIDFNIWQ
jgi:hypothetical protein